MNKLFQIGLAATALVAAMPAQAATFVVDLNDQMPAGTVTAGNPYGNIRTFTSVVGGETLNVKATAWSRANGGNAVQTAYLGQYIDTVGGTANGLGVINRNEGDGSTGNSHTIDNSVGLDFIVLQFSKAVTLTGGVLNAYALNGATARDNDAFVGADTLTGNWDQALSLTSWSAITAGLTASTTTSGNGTAAQRFNLSNVTGNMWIIGASVNNADTLDAFKLAQITATTAVSAVPEPATWAMMLVGFGMVAGAARYRRRKTTAVFA
ncbi:hypothetical protein ASG67_00775 [Sphingomonas sp. Leaf339]|uniref:PEPxxWA-CTERM sorting domain-containing protein n=1 Tax=Sphingomonas sp. Leaf339 TaxID=1736343 RepID=UPI0006F51553|nr:PEPxxWA-CTERM sorting domain-containing protein [Sphingomonas sp. Leaf339]KQU61756.1 hypothetical protein ASG67_00775 [Sphingomonas sp. Leaf339]